MPIELNGETAHKVVVIGERGRPSHLLERRPSDWTIANWKRADDQGGPGEPVMDWASFDVGLEIEGTPHRVFFFGHGISRVDLVRLGPETKTAMFKRIDHLVV